MLRKNEIPTFKDYEKHKIVLIYSRLIIEANVKFLKHQGRTKVKKKIFLLLLMLIMKPYWRP